MVEALGVADLCRTSETEKMPRSGEPGGAIMRRRRLWGLRLGWCGSTDL